MVRETRTTAKKYLRFRSNQTTANPYAAKFREKMKKVFTDPSQIAHLFANQEQKDARTSSHNLYFNGKSIFSYGSHFCIAKHTTNEKGQNCILFTERKYSVTTAKHLQIVRSACSHLNLVYCFNPESTHSQNFSSWLNEIESISRNLPKAKKPEKYLNQIDGVNYKVKKYAEFFALSIPENLAGAMAISSKEDLAQYTQKKEEAQKLAEKAAAKYLKNKIASDLRKWRAGKIARLYSRAGFDFLRINEEAQRIETSQGVEIPIETAKRFWAVILRTIKNGGCKNCGIPLLSYTLNEINENFISVGCHKIQFSELQKTAKLLNLI